MFSRLLPLAAGLLLAGAARADTLEIIRERGEMVYGCDQEGGGPFAFPDPKNVDHLIGFEVDLAEALAKKLSQRFGKTITAKFFQGPWDQLPNLLQTQR